MDISSIAATAAGISGIFGLLGFIAFAVLRLSGKYSSSLKLTPELVSSLKNHGVSAELVRHMGKEELRQYLIDQGRVSEQLIGKVLAAEVRNQGKIVLWISAALLFLALALGLWGISRSDQKSPVPPSDIEILEQKDEPLGAAATILQEKRTVVAARFEGRKATSVAELGEFLDYEVDCAEFDSPSVLDLVITGSFGSQRFNTLKFLRSLSDIEIVSPTETLRISHEVDGVFTTPEELKVVIQFYGCDKIKSAKLAFGPLVMPLDLKNAHWKRYSYETSDGATKRFWGVRRKLRISFPKPAWPISYLRFFRPALPRQKGQEDISLLELDIHNLSDSSVAVDDILITAALDKTYVCDCMENCSSSWRSVQLDLTKMVKRASGSYRISGWTRLNDEKIGLAAEFRPEACYNPAQLSLKIPTQIQVLSGQIARVGLKLIGSQPLDTAAFFRFRLSISSFLEESGELTAEVGANVRTYPKFVYAEGHPENPGELWR